MDTHVWLQTYSNSDSTITKALRRDLSRSAFDVEVLDPHAPGPFGIVLASARDQGLSSSLEDWSRNGLNRILVVLTDRSADDRDVGWQLLASGAADVIDWGEHESTIDVMVARLQRWQQIEHLLHSEVVSNRVVGEDKAWRSALRQIVEVARYSDDSVLLLGETGTGKEQIARLIHDLDRRQNKGELVILDCSTIVSDLAGSEFFGHERGAFTGAVSARDGAFAVADGGTLFLDEVGELPPPLQVQLLRVIQERMYKRVGSNSWRRTNFRLICATNRDLINDTPEHSFRRDLYYRIAGWVCMLPPLRDRPEDIIPLAQHFMNELLPDGYAPEFDEQVQYFLQSRSYPGNVRDLKNVALRILGRHVGPGPITIGDIPEDERPTGAVQPQRASSAVAFEAAVRQEIGRGAGLSEVRKIAEETAIRIVTSDEDGNLQRAAKRLGVTDRALQIRRAASRANGTHNGEAGSLN